MAKEYNRFGPTPPKPIELSQEEIKFWAKALKFVRDKGGDQLRLGQALGSCGVTRDQGEIILAESLKAEGNHTVTAARKPEINLSKKPKRK